MHGFTCTGSQVHRFIWVPTPPSIHTPHSLYPCLPQDMKVCEPSLLQRQKETRTEKWINSRPIGPHEAARTHHSTRTHSHVSHNFPSKQFNDLKGSQSFLTSESFNCVQRPSNTPTTFPRSVFFLHNPSYHQLITHIISLGAGIIVVIYNLT